MGAFEDETAIAPTGEGTWTTRLSPEWRIGDNANGGYALIPVLRAVRDRGGQPDPLSVTTHFLRPVRGGGPAEVRAELVRRGRTTSVGRGTLVEDGRERLTVLAAFGDLSESVGIEGELSLPPPELPPPERCPSRAELAQGVALPILGRLDVRIDPRSAVAGGSAEAVVAGWIRFADGSDPTPLALGLFVDAFPPALYASVGSVGWVPTVELTVHVRRRPAPGWVRARFECDDLVGGRMIETGSLWDAEGTLVARSRQIGLLLRG